MYKKIILSTFLVLLFSGCASKYPMGLDEDSWNSLSAETKANLALEQSKIDEKRRQDRQKKWEIEQKIKLQKIEAEQKRLDTIYSQAKYGDILNINIYNGYLEYYGDLLHILPTAFVIARGETKQIKVTAKNSKKHIYEKTLWAKFNTLGNKLTLTLVKPTSYGTHEEIIILNNGRWHTERKYKTSYDDGYKKIKNVLIGVRYADFTKKAFRKMGSYNSFYHK